MSQDDIDMRDFCDSAGSDDTGGQQMVETQQMVEKLMEVRVLILD